MDSVAASSLDALTTKYTEVTYNLANASTVGYKRRISEFSLVPSTDPNDPTGETIEVKTTVDLTQGQLIPTGRRMDFALNGPGMFVVETPSGPIYTRNGQFRVSANSQLVDYVGRHVAGTNGVITFPGDVNPSNVTVTREGILKGDGKTIAQLKLARFDSAADLEPIGDSTFVPNSDTVEAKAVDPKTTTVQQGFTEASNVSTVEGLVDLITVTRLYEANISSMKTEDETIKNILAVAMS